MTTKTSVNAKTLNAIIVAFRAEMKAAKKTAEAIDAFAVECMDAGIKRADAAKALAIAVRKELLKDPEYVAREAESGKPFTSLKAICRSIENRWTYSCNKLGYTADESAAARGGKGGKAKQITAAKGAAKTNGSAPESGAVRPGALKTQDVADKAAMLKATVSNVKSMQEIASMAGTLPAKQRLAVAKMFLDSLKAEEIAELLADYAPKAGKARKAA